MQNPIHIFWFRRDLRLNDNRGLCEALSSNLDVLPLFIFDENILNNLPKNDHRVNFIYNSILEINNQLEKYGKSIKVLKGKPIELWNELTETYDIKKVSFNKDYEPYAIKRDSEITNLLESKNIVVNKYKDQVIFEENEILKSNGSPYTVFTPYKKTWLTNFSAKQISFYPSEELISNFLSIQNIFPTKVELGITESSIEPPTLNLKNILDYTIFRDYPSKDSTTKVGLHLRFGTISIRFLVMKAIHEDEVFLSELIWREFFMQIIFHFPHVVSNSFKSKYDAIEWNNNPAEFERWKNGSTGYPLVDAGMRELNNTGFMHNRVRMVVASFLCKHLLIDWRWGEAYFAEKLFDYDLSANNGNWQWAAGCGCDAAPYFRIFNPETQLKKFDNKLKYLKKWVPEFEDFNYPKPMVEHSFARNRVLERYKKALIKKNKR